MSTQPPPPPPAPPPTPVPPPTPIAGYRRLLGYEDFVKEILKKRLGGSEKKWWEGAIANTLVGALIGFFATSLVDARKTSVENDRAEKAEVHKNGETLLIAVGDVSNAANDLMSLATQPPLAKVEEERGHAGRITAQFETWEKQEYLLLLLSESFDDVPDIATTWRGVRDAANARKKCANDYWLNGKRPDAALKSCEAAKATLESKVHEFSKLCRDALKAVNAKSP